MLQADGQLIARFNAQRSEDAFAALVRHHVNLVFGTAVRQVGDSGAAEEITQNVFVALAEASGKLGAHPTIAGWLHQTTLNKSREWLRSEFRRRRREYAAANLELAEQEGDSVWLPLVPLLDEALLELREPDRLAVIMHFMEGQTFREVGSVLGVGEDAVRKRVHRCLNQLTVFFRRHGFSVPALATSAPLFALSSSTTPPGLATTATTAGLSAAHSAASTSTLASIKGALKFMALTKIKTAIVACVAVILAAGTTTVLVEKHIQTQQSSPASAPWSDVGSSTPKDTLQSLAWALTHDQIERAQELMQWNLKGTPIDFPTGQAGYQKLILEHTLAPQVKQIQSFRILSIKQAQGPDALDIKIEEEEQNGTFQPLVVKVRRVNNQWRAIGYIEYFKNGNEINVSLKMPFTPAF